MPPNAGSDGSMNDVWAFLGTIAAAATIVFGNFVRGYRAARPEDSPDLRRQKVVLEASELADLSSIDRLVRDLRPGLERLAGSVERDHDLMTENSVKLRLVLEGLDRLQQRVERIDEEVRIAARLEQHKRDGAHP